MLRRPPSPPTPPPLQRRHWAWRWIPLALAAAGAKPAMAQAPADPSLAERDRAALRALHDRFAADADPQTLTQALLEQAWRAHPASTAWLLQRGAACDTPGAQGWTLLMVAADGLPPPPAPADPALPPGAEEVPWTGAPEQHAAAEAVFDLALACTRAPNARNAQGRTAVHRAALRKRYDAVLRLARHGADLNAGDATGGTVLMDAPEGELAALVKAGADVNARDARGRTLLHHAFLTQRGDALLARVRTALALGAHDQPDAQGRFATDMETPMAWDPRHPLRPGQPQLQEARRLVQASRRTAAAPQERP